MTSTVRKMGSSWLVQRLKKPHTGVLGKDNPFAFGGGLRNGGLSDDAMDLIRGIFSFDYMGAAEFEFGAVPKAFRDLAQSSLTRFSFTIALAEVAPNWRDKQGAVPQGEATIYVLCPVEHTAEVEERIRHWAKEPYPRLKEMPLLPGALRPVEEWDRDACGWLELDNGFMFFTDAEMWEQTCTLFGVSE